MDEFRIEKRLARAKPTLSTHRHVQWRFFVSSIAETHVGAERVDDALNTSACFFSLKSYTMARAGKSRSSVQPMSYRWKRKPQPSTFAATPATL